MARTVKQFNPKENKTISWSSTSNSQSVQFTTKIDDPAKFPSNILIFNATTVVVFVAWNAGSAPTADTTGFAVGPGMDILVDIGQNDYVAVIPIGSVTGSVYISRGLGS